MMKNFLFLLMLLSTILSLNAQTHYKGLHNALPFYITAEKSPLIESFKFKFTEENKYIFKDENQMDFNKLLGYKGKYFTPRFNTVMVAWRYNPIIDKFQVLPYFHIGSKNYDFNELKIINLDVNEECISTIKIFGKSVYVTLKSTKSESSEVREFTENYDKFWFVLPWFGGNYAAPKKMNLFIEPIRF